MSDRPLEEARQSRNRLAADWRVQVGADGDSNRRLNSDPVLWEFAGDVRGLAVLDAGCGTGYLSRKLRDRGARVTGVDLAERMVEIARADHPDIDFRVDSCTELATLGDGEFDLVIANYVLMDTHDLGATMRAFARDGKVVGGKGKVEG
jgi:2-polyprenyl-3-methyl-5-hydroxy-6-metoxy-1,4-benzoquinol methylase